MRPTLTPPIHEMLMITPNEQAVAKAAEAASASPDKLVGIIVGIMAIIGGLYTAGVWLLRPVRALRRGLAALSEKVDTMKEDQEERIARVEHAISILPSLQADMTQVKTDVAVSKATTERTEAAVGEIGKNLLTITAALGEVKGALGRTRGDATI